MSGNAWIANGNNTVTEIGANGSSGTVFSGGSMNSPSGVAIDASGNVWVTNSGGDLPPFSHPFITGDSRLG